MLDDAGGRTLGTRIEKHAAGKIWWYRAPLGMFFGWILLQHVLDPDYRSVFSGLNLAIHEGGHLFFMWFGVDFLTVAADARTQLLPLVSPFRGAPQHDWTYLLQNLGLLRFDAQVGRAFHDVGILTMAAGLATGAWVLKLMAGAPRAPDDQPQSAN